MIHIIKHFLKNYPWSSTLVVFIWVLSLTPIFPHTPLDTVQFIDKWEHIAMYTSTGVIVWVEYLRAHKSINKRQILLYAIIAPFLMSGILELLQEYCTCGKRSGEWLDLLANTIGIFLAAIIGFLLSKKFYPKP